MLTEAGGPLLFKARFIRPLKRTLVQHFLDNQPELAVKLAPLEPRLLRDAVRARQVAE